jgi:hypothetical protein
MLDRSGSPDVGTPSTNQWDYDVILEVVAAVLLGLATFGSAWCAYQATQWHGEQNMEVRVANGAQYQSQRAFYLATQRVAFDAAIAAEYARAVAEARTDLLGFYRDALVRPEFLPVIDNWLAEVRDGQAGATNLLQNLDYIDQQFLEARDFDAAAARASERAAEAGRHADGYVQVTVFMAISLFFAGIKLTFRTMRVRIAMVGASAVILAFSVVRVAGLPIA